MPRRRLYDALDGGADRLVTAVVGPPGCGKTVAVASWVATQTKTPTVWMSCDERDAEPVRFWRGAVEALQTRWPGSGAEVRDLLDEDVPRLAEIAAAFSDEINELGEPVSIVVDDLHLAKQATASLGVAIEAQPAAARWVLVSRADPALPLHQMRLRQELVELREDDLRLSADETAALALALGLQLHDGEAALLHERTNGWMAAVHLAALSLRGRGDAREFLLSFSGENRLVAEFLFAEVLSTLPVDVRQFLEDTSVLDELDSAACRAVSGRTDGYQILSALAAAGMLVSPHGDGESYRYHQLFRDLLQFRLRANSPERFVTMHKIAAQVYESRGEFDRAAAHFTTAGDDRAAFAVLRDHAVDLFVSRGGSAVEQLVSVLDLRHATVEPGRAAAVAVALALAGADEEAERWIARVERAGATLTPTDQGRIAVARSVLRWLRGDALGCDAALSGIPQAADPSDAVIDTARLLRLNARLLLGDIPGARAAYRAATEHSGATLEVDEVMLASAFSWVSCLDGTLREAERLANGALSTSERLGTVGHPMIASALRTRGRIAYERGDFETADAELERSIALSERVRPVQVSLGRLNLARVQIAEGRMVEAAASLEEARSVLRARSNNPVLDLITACEAQLALATGDVASAEELSRSLPSSERRLRLQAKVRLTQQRPGDALELLSASQPSTLRESLDTSVLRTRAEYALRHPAAGDSLASCVALARREGFVIALTEGLSELSGRLSYQLRSGPVGQFEKDVLDRLDRPHAPLHPMSGVELVDGLTQREEIVLRYLDSRLTIKEIAAECFVSRNTVRTHVKAIYRKLGASSRREAIAEARQLQLL